MAITPFIFAPFGNPSRGPSPESATDLSFVRNFDIRRPAVMVFFAHGHEATLQRDIVARQQVLQQLERAGLNAVLVAPQLAYNEASSSPGRFGERGFAGRFFEEAAQRLAQMHDQQRNNQARPSPQTLATFRQMPIMMVSYSGGYGATFAIMNEAMSEIPRTGPLNQTDAQPTLAQRIRGAVLLDTLYGGGDTIRRFASQPHRPYVVSSFIENPRNNLPMQTNLQLQQYFGLRSALAPGRVSDRQNVRIYQDYGSHGDLVERGLTRALHYIPGYRHDGPTLAETEPNNQIRPSRWTISLNT